MQECGRCDVILCVMTRCTISLMQMGGGLEVPQQGGHHARH
jgi:hypothetical protein